IRMPHIDPLFPYTTLFRSTLPFAESLAGELGFEELACSFKKPANQKTSPRKLAFFRSDLASVNFTLVFLINAIIRSAGLTNHIIDRKSTRLNSSHVSSSYA